MDSTAIKWGQAMSLNLKPKKNVLVLKPKKKDSTLSLTPKKKLRPRKQNTHIQNVITQYITDFHGVIYSHINKTAKRFPVLQREEIIEDMYSRFCEKFTAAIVNRTIQLWCINGKMMNVYIQQMVKNIGIDMIRTTFKHEGPSKRISLQDTDDNAAYSLASYHQPTINGEYAVMLQELYNKASAKLKEYNPDGYKLMQQLLDPQSNVNLSSPKVYNLKREFIAILESLK
jgi:hypothetical protein